MKNYTMSQFSSAKELKEAVMRDGSLSDMEKLRFVFGASKEDLRLRDVQLYYAILGVLDSAKRPVPARLE